jgi:hypothetical protein
MIITPSRAGSEVGDRPKGPVAIKKLGKTQEIGCTLRLRSQKYFGDSRPKPNSGNKEGGGGNF